VIEAHSLRLAALVTFGLTSLAPDISSLVSKESIIIARPLSDTY